MQTLWYYSLFDHIFNYFIIFQGNEYLDVALKPCFIAQLMDKGRFGVWAGVTVFGVTKGHSEAEESLRGMGKAACMREAGSMMELPATAVLPGGLNGFGSGTKSPATPSKSCLTFSTAKRKQPACLNQMRGRFWKRSWGQSVSICPTGSHLSQVPVQGQSIHQNSRNSRLKTSGADSSSLLHLPRC